METRYASLGASKKVRHGNSTGKQKTRNTASWLAWALILATLTLAPAAQELPQAKVVGPTDRTVLPLPEPQYPHSTVFDVRNATPPPDFRSRRQLTRRTS